MYALWICTPQIMASKKLSIIRKFDEIQRMFSNFFPYYHFNERNESKISIFSGRYIIEEKLIICRIVVKMKYTEVFTTRRAREGCADTITKNHNFTRKQVKDAFHVISHVYWKNLISFRENFPSGALIKTEIRNITTDGRSISFTF